jgi:hypothetical protein
MDPVEVWHVVETLLAAGGSFSRVSLPKFMRRCCHPSLTYDSTRRAVVAFDNGRSRLPPRIARAPSAMTLSSGSHHCGGSGDQEPARSIQDGLAVRSLLSQRISVFLAMLLWSRCQMD